MNNRKEDNGNKLWKSVVKFVSNISMESSSDDETSKNLNEIANTCVSSMEKDDATIPVDKPTRPARVFYDGKKVPQSAPDVAEHHPVSSQKNRSSKCFKKNYFPSRRSRDSNMRRDSRIRGPSHNSRNFRSNFNEQSSNLSQESDDDSMSVNSNENPQVSNKYDIEYLPNSVNVDKMAHQVNEKGDGKFFSTTFASHQDRLEKLRKAKEEYESMMNIVSPQKIILDYRNRIEKLASDCTKHNLDKINKIRALIQEQPAYSQVLELHKENLSLQQKNFDNFINSMKQNCFALNNINDSNTDDIIKKADKILFKIEKECNLFERKLPAYAYKSDVLNALNDNQILIISADSSYFFNTATPVIVMSKLYDYFVVSCENSKISCEWVKHDIQRSMKHPIEDFSGINFMHTEEMLSYLRSPKASRKNCFILNLSLKRSVTSDLSLAILNKVLAEQKNSKLILLLSVFDNIKVYQKYFSSFCVHLLEVPKLLFPVKTVWKKEQLGSKNYKEDVVCTVLSIHILNNPGDVLAFLPCLTDARRILALLVNKIKEMGYDNDLECFLLHEDTTNILDFKNPLKRGKKRNIFLATHSVEAIPLPSVLYVVDCGLVRDYIFDNSKNLDILTTTFNSRARARLRKSLAGVYRPGICYRIFTKENFCQDMRSYELPDILTLNPFNTLIKIFYHYPEKGLSLQFVEPLSDVVKYNTIKQLKNFNAIKDMKLTQLGEKIVKLPFTARYSKLILQGIHWGFGYEAVILVAYFSVDSFLFKFSQDEKYQQVIDASKLDLMQNESDALSFLQIYKTWVENGCGIGWCDEFNVDFNTLNKVKGKVSEVCQIVSENVNENIVQEFSDVENSFENILEMLFQCFSDNLCVFSGHYRCGYRVLSSQQTAFIHPSSIICNKENLPQLIIYDKIKKSSRYFLLGITAIPCDLVISSIAEKSLEFEYSDIFERTLKSATIEPVGERIIKQVLLGVKGKKLLEIENTIKEKVKSDYVVIDPCVDKGCVNVYALEPILKDVVNMVDQILKSNLNDVINAETSYTLELEKGEMVIPLEVKCGMGAKITSVEVKKETQSSLSTNNSKKVVSEAMKDNTSSIKCSINLTWIRRPCIGVCYVSFTLESFMQARKLAMQKILILQNEVYIERSSRDETELVFTELPPETRAADVEEAIKKHFPNVTILKTELKFTKSFETTSEDIEEIRMKIQEMCDDCEDLIRPEIIIPKPKNTATIMTAYINVSGSVDLTSAAEKLSNRMIKNFKINALPVYRSVNRVSFKVFKALELRIKEGIEKLKHDLSKAFPNRDLFRFQDDRNNTNLVLFKLLSNDMKVMKQLQRTINDLLEGEMLSKNQVQDIHKLFCHGGHLWLRKLEDLKKVYIVEEYNSKTIRVYGSRDSCFEVKECILNFLEDTENEAVEKIILSNDKSNRILMKSIIKEYGVHLKKFVEQCELRSAELDIKACRLLLHGSRDSIDKAKELLDKISNQLDSTEEYSLLSGGEFCPVCACPAFNLTMRLQHCNHLYCRDCIVNLVEQAQFPIQCCAKDCSQDIVLDDIIKILDEDDVKIKKLLRASLNDYLVKNKSEIFYCPAPDCPMFAYKNQVSDKWICPLCRNEICTNCNVVYHYGFTCDVYQGSKKDPDYSFKEWQKGRKECKICPKCKTAIEKESGCNRMTCNCGASFCWICLKAFSSQMEAYSHIERAHPGLLFS